MNIKIIAIPLIHKLLGVLMIIFIFFAMGISLIERGTVVYGDDFLFIIAIYLIAGITGFYGVFIISCLKVSNNEIYVLRFIKWKKINMENIHYIKYKPQGYIVISANGISLLNKVFVPVGYSSKGNNLASNMNNLLREGRGLNETVAN